MTKRKVGKVPPGGKKAGERVPFLPYNHGLGLDQIRIGSLYLDPRNPHGFKSERVDYRPDIPEHDRYEEHIKLHCWKEQPIPKFKKTYWRNKHTGAGFTMASLATFQFNKEDYEEVALTGIDGRRLTLKDPEGFLEDHVMKQPEVKTWLKRHAQASRTSFSLFSGVTWDAPKVWMCSGVQMLRSGNIGTVTSQSMSMSGKFKVDVGPAVGVPPGVTKSGANADHSHESGGEEEKEYEGEHVWGATFIELNIQYGSRGQDDITTINPDSKTPKSVTVNLNQEVNFGLQGFRGDPIPDKTITESMAIFSLDPSAVAASITESDDMELDSTIYLEALEEVDWERYKKEQRYISDREEEKRHEVEI